MKKSLHVIAAVAAVLFLFSSVSLLLNGESNDSDAKEIVKKMDELYRSLSSEALMEMEIITPHWKRTLKMKFWTRGMKKTFIRILAPKKEKGIATLKMGNEMWNFLPKTDKVMKIPPSLMMGSWMGSDFTNDDLVKEYTFTEDYTFKKIDTEIPGTISVRCIPKKGLPIVWGHQVIIVNEKDYMPVKQEYYDEKGVLIRVLTFKEPRAFGKRTIPAVMELTPRNKKGKKTIIRYLEAEFDGNIDKKIFSQRNLRTRI
ncbi:MAG: outer membrane lipoprotein-sorting protein [bacterium]|nr:outer membrane lipoprotein-sorting protein [bacterium]